MKSFKVLLIDDEEELVSTFVERLEIRGINAVAATRGGEALKLIEEDGFNVVVVDLKMPGIGGMELINLLKKSHPDIKVILITGHVSHSDEPEDMYNGAFEVLLKPFSLDRLLEVINNAINS